MNAFCNKCGKKLEQDNKFCKFCGVKIEQSEITSNKGKPVNFYKKCQNVILIICVYASWYVIIDEFMSYRANEQFLALTITILTIYVWNKIIEQHE